MILCYYYHWIDAHKTVEAMKDSKQWEESWIEADTLGDIPVYAVYGLARNPNDPLLINNAYDAY